MRSIFARPIASLFRLACLPSPRVMPQAVALADGAPAVVEGRPVPHLVWPRPIGSGSSSSLSELGEQPRGERDASADVPRLPRGAVLDMPVTFHAQPRDYARLWLKNLLLTLLTLGLYLPWARVRAQRFFMRHTTVAGHRLDYHATPRSVWPRYGQCLSLLLGVAGSWAGSTVAGMLALSLAMAAWPLVVYMSLVHRMAHISWDGRRLAFDGACQGVYKTLWVPLAFGCALAWALLGALALQRPTAWIAWGMVAAVWVVLAPGFMASWLLYRQRHLRLGPLRLLWKASRPALYAMWLRTLVWAMLSSALALGLGAVAVALLVVLKGRFTSLDLSVTAAVCAVLALGAVYPYAQARLQNLVWSKTGSRHLRFRSRLSVSRYVRLQVRSLVLLCLTGGLYWPWAVVASRRMRTQALTVWTRVDADVLKAHWPTHTVAMARARAAADAVVAVAQTPPASTNSQG